MKIKYLSFCWITKNICCFHFCSITSNLSHHYSPDYANIYTVLHTVYSFKFFTRLNSWEDVFLSKIDISHWLAEFLKPFKKQFFFLKLVYSSVETKRRKMEKIFTGKIFSKKTYQKQRKIKIIDLKAEKYFKTFFKNLSDF